MRQQLRTPVSQKISILNGQTNQPTHLSQDAGAIVYNPFIPENEFLKMRYDQHKKTMQYVNLEKTCE